MPQIVSFKAMMAELLVSIQVERAIPAIGNQRRLMTPHTGQAGPSGTV